MPKKKLTLREKYEKYINDKEFIGHHFIIQEDNTLLCKPCNYIIAKNGKKSTIKDHITSNVHKNNLAAFEKKLQTKEVIKVKNLKNICL
jgi:hypothetical protein